MNNLFRDNYEKKMALIGVLKAYAENRSVDKLAKSLVLVLQTPSHRRLLPYIRSVISLLPTPVSRFCCPALNTLIPLLNPVKVSKTNKLLPFPSVFMISYRFYSIIELSCDDCDFCGADCDTYCVNNGNSSELSI